MREEGVHRAGRARGKAPGWHGRPGREGSVPACPAWSGAFTGSLAAAAGGQGGQLLVSRLPSDYSCQHQVLVWERDSSLPSCLSPTPHPSSQTRTATVGCAVTWRPPLPLSSQRHLPFPYRIPTTGCLPRPSPHSYTHTSLSLLIHRGLEPPNPCLSKPSRCPPTPLPASHFPEVHLGGLRNIAPSGTPSSQTSEAHSLGPHILRPSPRLAA